MGDEHIDNKLEEQNCEVLVKLFSAYKPKTKQTESDTNYNIAYASITATGRIYTFEDTRPGDYKLAFNITDGCPLNMLLGGAGIIQPEKPVRIEQSKAPNYIKEIAKNAFESAKKKCKEKNKTEVLGKNYVRRNGILPKTKKKGLVERVLQWFKRE